MTLQQLRYVAKIAQTKSLTQAAKELFISQPSLTKALKDLEREMGVVIFERSNKGIAVSKEGEVFLGYARQVLEQTALLEEHYKKPASVKQSFCVSTQHYSFAVDAFVEFVKECPADSYDFSLRETQTYEIIDDVTKMKSEIGILYYNDFNEKVLTKIFRENSLAFDELFVAQPHIFVCKQNPLAAKPFVTMQDLEGYPYLSFEQGEHNSFYFSEEIFFPQSHAKNIRVRDRATLFNLLIGLNGYTISSGVIDEKLNGENIVSVALEAEGQMHIGTLTNKKAAQTPLGRRYVQKLRQATRQS